MRPGLRAAAGALVLAACTQSPAPPVQDRPTPAATATAASTGSTGSSTRSASPGVPASTGSGPAATATATPTGRGQPGRAQGLQADAVARLPLPTGARLTGLALGRGRVAWSLCRACRGQEPAAAEVRVAPANGSGSARVVARAAAGRTAAVVGFAGDALVWLDVGPGPGEAWVLRLVDVRTGASRALDDGRGTGPGARTPLVSAGERTVTWQLYDLATGRGPVVAQDVAGGRSRVLVADLPGQLRGVTAQGLVYTANDPAVPTVVPNAPVPYDLYLWPPVGRPRNLTRGHDIAGAVATTDGVVWRVADATESLVYAAWPGGTPVRLIGRPVLAFGAGRGFGVWVTREADPIVQLGTGGGTVTLPDAPPLDGGKLAVDGDEVAFVGSRDRGGPAWWLVVVRVVRGDR